MYDVIIVGSGVAGMTAAIYAERAGLKHLLLEKEPVPGGQIIKAGEVDNYPGMNKISGAELALAMQKHCKELGVNSERGKVSEINVISKLESKNEIEGYSIMLSNGTSYEARNIIIAVGAKPRLLGLEEEEKYVGRGISYCATCDGNFYRGKKVAVIGGGDTALKDVLYLANIASHVFLVHRRNEFRGSVTVFEEIKKLENVYIITEAVPESIEVNLNSGEVQSEIFEKNVTGLWISNVKTKERRFLDCEGIFVAIGNVPETESFGDIVELDESGYVLAGENCKTSKPGIFAIGDCRSGSIKQVVTAAADGAAAVSQIKSQKISN